MSLLGQCHENLISFLGVLRAGYLILGPVLYCKNWDTHTNKAHTEFITTERTEPSGKVGTDTDKDIGIRVHLLLREGFLRIFLGTHFLIF
jgi:hypothetical protein